MTPTFELAPDNERARDFISRANNKPTSKYPGYKIKRTLIAESIHEVHAFRRMDADPKVVSFREQPGIIRFRLPGQTEQLHYPDLLVVYSDFEEIVEIKSDVDADRPEVRERTAYLEKHLPNVGYRYRLWTETELYSGPYLRNASTLLRHGRRSVPTSIRAQYRRLLRAHGPQRWGDLNSGRLGEFFNIRATSNLVLTGCLHINRDRPIELGSLVDWHGNEGSIA
jgi:hypothetical protein